MDFSALLNKMLIFIVLMLIGYVFGRRGFLTREFNRVTSWLVINVFMVGTILSSMLGGEFTENVGEIPQYLLLTVLTQALCIAIAVLLTKVVRPGKEQEAVYELLLAFGNSMFVGLPIAEAAFGAKAVFIISISCIPFNLFVYTYGVLRLQGEKKEHLHLKDIFAIPLVATLLGILVLILRIPVPAALQGLFATLSGATAPLSMMVIGISLSSVSLTTAFRNGRLAILSAVRLLLMPVIVFFLCRLLTDDATLIMTCMILAGCPCAVLISVLAMQYDQDDVFSSEGVQHSTICSLVTLPLLIRLFSELV